MKRQMIWIECKKCGKTFDYSYRGFGRKPEVCESCRYQAQKEAQKRYEEKQKRIQVQEAQETGQYTEVLNQKAEEQFMNYTTQVLDLLGQLDNLRINMCNLLTELGQYQSNYDKQDQDFIHKIESGNFCNANDALTFVTKWQKDRQSRRSVKNLIYMLRDVVNVIPVKNKTTAINNIANNKLKEKNK